MSRQRDLKLSIQDGEDDYYDDDDDGELEIASRESVMQLDEVFPSCCTHL
jgi:hypothetical protein